MNVNSTKGRYKDLFYKVLKINENQRFTIVVDGVYKELADPIKKIIKLIEMNDIIRDVWHDNIQREKMFQDSEIARHIREFQEKKKKEMIECPNKM